MRDIKFRAWHKEEQRYLPIMEIHAFNWYVRTYDDKYRAFEINLEQFTGLHDKNGQEIYEGDIVEVTIVSDVYAPAKSTPLWATKKETNPVVIHPGIVTVGDRILCNYKSDQIEVIGNIHENPELC